MGNRSSQPHTLPRTHVLPVDVPLYNAYPPALGRSLLSLHQADSGYLTSPSDSDRWKLRSSRLSLNEFPLEPPPRFAFAPSPRTLKKMEKRHKKLMKKGLVPAMMPLPAFRPPPPLHAPFARAFSVDDLSGALRFDETPRGWRPPLGSPLGRPSPLTASPSGVVPSSLSSSSTRPRGRSSLESASSKETRESPRTAPPSHANGSATRRPLIGRVPRVAAPQSPGLSPRFVAEKRAEEERNRSEEARLHDDYASSVSSRTTNQQGDSSEIDFSWVKDEEHRLRNEENYDKPLPECFFGLDPPKVNAERSERGRSRHRQTDYRVEKMVDEKDWEKENRSLVESNVRAKTALFEHEAARCERDALVGVPGRAVNLRPQINKMRSRSTPRCEPFIPRPDYLEEDSCRKRRDGAVQVALARRRADEALQRERRYPSTDNYEQRQKWRSSVVC